MGKFIDMTGWVMKEHGVPDSRITVLRRVDDYISPKGYHITQWECQCDCGNIFVSSGNNIKNGVAKSCGCLQREIARNMVFKDITGQQFGKLTVMYRVDDFIDADGKHTAMWHCKCECGNEKDILGSSLRYGATRSCGCIQRKKASQLDENIRIRNNDGSITYKRCPVCGEFKNITEFHHNQCAADGYTSTCKDCARHTLGRRYKNYKQGAKSRNLDFDLTKDEFDKITKQPCEYCGEYSGEFLGICFCGIDRIDSNQGYVKNNVVACCETCNRMKWDYKIDDWINKMKKILKYMEDNSEQTL